MLTINRHLLMSDKIRLFRILRKEKSKYSLIKDGIEENNIAGIYDHGLLCGGILIFGSEKPVYLFCFFEEADYCTESYHSQLKAAIHSVFPEISHYDVYHINSRLLP